MIVYVNLITHNWYCGEVGYCYYLCLYHIRYIQDDGRCPGAFHVGCKEDSTEQPTVESSTATATSSKTTTTTSNTTTTSSSTTSSTTATTAADDSGATKLSLTQHIVLVVLISSMIYV